MRSCRCSELFAELGDLAKRDYGGSVFDFCPTCARIARVMMTASCGDNGLAGLEGEMVDFSVLLTWFWIAVAVA